jgi:predicted component of type VI protein secretion system
MHCGTVLPAGALFCGECGRSLAAAKPAAPEAAAVHRTPLQRAAVAQSAPVRWVEDPVTGSALENETEVEFTAGTELDADEIDVEVGPGDVRCEQCQAIMGGDDIFCGECGFVSRSITRAFSSDFTGETRQVDLTRPEPDPGIPSPQSVAPVAPSAPPLATSPLATPPLAARPPAPRAPRTEPAPPRNPTPRSFLPPDDTDDLDDLEATRIVNRVSGNRFVLQFSTGESFTVHGSGLIGRNPQPEPGEFFDHLIRVLDTGKSVSKTHLEFGQESGAFWLKDRFSGNGTILREPDISARRAEPDRRYRVVRGTRVDIGEQFFVIS